MKAKNIVITEADYQRLRRFIEISKHSRTRDAEHLESLEKELDRATVVKSDEIAHNVVTINSRVRVKDLNDGREIIYHIVLPGRADVGKDRISVLAPIGTGLLGYSVGTTLEWRVPSGIRRLRILAVEYQPDAAATAAA
jgi:regulator of nucleoside diphosphate kinase